MFDKLEFEMSGINGICLILIVGGALLLFYMEIRKIKVQMENITREINILTKDNPSKLNQSNYDPNIMNSVGPKYSEEIPAGQRLPVQEIRQVPVNQGPIAERVNINTEDNLFTGPNTNENLSIEESILSETLDDSGKNETNDFTIKDIINGDTGSDIDSDIDSDINGYIGSDIVGDINSDIGSDVGSDIGSDIGSDVGSDIGSDIVSDIDAKTGIDYTKCTVNELKSILSELNLPLSGNKTKLIQRINENK